MSTLQKRVLVVDDDPIIGRSFKGVLGKGYAVITASNGKEALDKLNSEEYDVVFADLKMPEMGGIEMAKAIKEKQPWLPVVIITGYGSGDSRKQAEELGVSDFLDKPLSPEMIEKSTAAALKKGEAPLDLVLEAEADETEGIAESILVLPRNAKLYFKAPFVGLAKTITLPLKGLDMLAAFGEAGLVKRGVPAALAWFLRNVTFICLGTIMELVYLASLPIAGLGILAWLGAAKLSGVPIEIDHIGLPHEQLYPTPPKEGARRAVLQKVAAPQVKAAAVEGEPGTFGDYLKAAMMLVTAPFIGLVYIFTFPFVGLGTLAFMGVREMVRLGLPERFAVRIKNIALFFIAPFIGLAYMVALPFVGLAVLAWMGIKAAKSRFAK